MPRATNRCQNSIVSRHFFTRTARYATTSRVNQTMPTNRPWPPLAKPPQLGTDDVHAWAVPLDVPKQTYEGLLATLAPDERQRASEFRFDDPRRRYVIARGTLRRLLGEYLHAEPTSIELTIDQNKKPRLASQHATANLHFNVSHSGDLAVIGFARMRDRDRRRAATRSQSSRTDRTTILSSVRNEHRVGRRGVCTKLGIPTLLDRQGGNSQSIGHRHRGKPGRLPSPHRRRLAGLDRILSGART